MYIYIDIIIKINSYPAGAGPNNLVHDLGCVRPLGIRNTNMLLCQAEPSSAAPNPTIAGIFTSTAEALVSRA